MGDPAATMIVNAALLDVEGGTYLDADRLLVADGRIVEIGSGRLSAPDGAAVVDAAGRTVLPGLIDAHVHVTAVTADMSAHGDLSSSYVAAYGGQELRATLRRGFTTVRDVGGADHGLAAAVEDGLFSGPRLLFGGPALSQTGGHGDMRPAGRTTSTGPACCPAIGQVCDGVDEVRKAAREQLRTGAHHIKLMLSGGVASPTDRIDSVQFSEDEIRAVVQEADAANRYVAGHAYTARAIERGLRCGGAQHRARQPPRRVDHRPVP